MGDRGAAARGPTSGASSSSNSGGVGGGRRSQTGCQARDAAIQRLMQLRPPEVVATQSEEEQVWDEHLVRSLVKRVGKADQLHDLECALRSQSPSSQCIPIFKSQDGRVQVQQRKCIPHVCYPRLWRWPDLTSQHQVAPLANCIYPYTKKLELVCVNPFHLTFIPNAVPSGSALKESAAGEPTARALRGNRASNDGGQSMPSSGERLPPPSPLESDGSPMHSATTSHEFLSDAAWQQQQQTRKSYGGSSEQNKRECSSVQQRRVVTKDEPPASCLGDDLWQYSHWTESRERLTPSAVSVAQSDSPMSISMAPSLSADQSLHHHHHQQQQQQQRRHPSGGDVTNTLTSLGTSKTTAAATAAVPLPTTPSISGLEPLEDLSLSDSSIWSLLATTDNPPTAPSTSTAPLWTSNPYLFHHPQQQQQQQQQQSGQSTAPLPGGCSLMNEGAPTADDLEQTLNDALEVIANEAREEERRKHEVAMQRQREIFAAQQAAIAAAAPSSSSSSSSQQYYQQQLQQQSANRVIGQHPGPSSSSSLSSSSHAPPQQQVAAMPTIYPSSSMPVFPNFETSAASPRFPPAPPPEPSSSHAGQPPLPVLAHASSTTALAHFYPSAHHPAQRASPSGLSPSPSGRLPQFHHRELPTTPREQLNAVDPRLATGALRTLSTNIAGSFPPAGQMSRQERARLNLQRLFAEESDFIMDVKKRQAEIPPSTSSEIRPSSAVLRMQFGCRPRMSTVAVFPGAMPCQQSVASRPASDTAKEWCHVLYYELSERLGSLFRFCGHQLVIDGFCQPTQDDRFSLGLIQNLARNPTVTAVRKQIGGGLRLERGEDGVWLESLCDSPLFVQAPGFAIQEEDCPSTVYRLVFGSRVQLLCFDTFNAMLEEAKPMGFNKVYSLKALCQARVSFVKGWGAQYRRQTIMNTPCWLELLLMTEMSAIDKVLRSCMATTNDYVHASSFS